MWRCYLNGWFIALQYFVFFCLFYNSIVDRFKISHETLVGLIIAWAIFSMWFPFRLFSDWTRWYQDLDHLTTGDPPFFITFVFAAIAFAMLVIDFVVTLGRLDPIKTAGTAWGAIVAAFGLLVALKPGEFTIVFRILYSLDISLVVPAVLLLFGIVAGQTYAFIAMPNTREPFGSKLPDKERVLNRRASPSVLRR